MTTAVHLTRTMTKMGLRPFRSVKDDSVVPFRRLWGALSAQDAGKFGQTAGVRVTNGTYVGLSGVFVGCWGLSARRNYDRVSLRGNIWQIGTNPVPSAQNNRIGR